MDPSEIFDRRARRQHRDRALAHHADADFVRRHMLEGLIERIEGLDGSFEEVLDLGSHLGEFALPGARVARLDPGFGFARVSRGVQGDEDRLPFADEAFDLVISAGLLDQVNDLPGALALIRRTLRPGGLFLGAFLGAGSLTALRSALRTAEPEPPAPRLHPQIDVRSAGDLLARAGFTGPVADTETLTVRYAALGRLLADLRAMAATNLLRDRQPLRRDVLERTQESFAAAARNGRTSEQFEIVYMTGRRP